MIQLIVLGLVLVLVGASMLLPEWLHRRRLAVIRAEAERQRVAYARQYAELWDDLDTRVGRMLADRARRERAR